MSQYINLIVPPSMTWTFNSLTIVNDLLFAYFLHKCSKRLPIPLQYSRPRNVDDARTLSRHKLDYNLYNNKALNCCWKWLFYKNLIAATFPSDFYRDLTPDRRREILEAHWNALQDQTSDDSTLVQPPPQPPQRASASMSGGTGGGRRGVFGITASRVTGVVLKRRKCSQYMSLSLRLWSVALGLIAFALSASFWLNVLLEYVIACIFNHGDHSQVLGLFAIFAIVHVSLWWLKRQWQALRLLWYNVCDHFQISVAVIWRCVNLGLCLSFTISESLNSDLTLSDSIFWQLFLRWMVIQGLIWELGFCFMAFFMNVWVIYRVYLRRYDFVFVSSLGQSNLHSLQQKIQSMSGAVRQKMSAMLASGATKGAKGGTKGAKEAADHESQTETVPEDSAIDDQKDEEEEETKMEHEQADEDEEYVEVDRPIARLLSLQEQQNLDALKEMHRTQESLLQNMAVQKSCTLHAFVEFMLALKDDEDYDAVYMVCKHRVPKRCVKYFYVLMVWVSFITCFAVGRDDEETVGLFAGYIFLMYYVIVLFRRAKYNALYCFWSSRYHTRFYANWQIIRSFEEQKRGVSRGSGIVTGAIASTSVNGGGLLHENEDIESVGQIAAITSTASDESSHQKIQSLPFSKNADVGSGYIAMEDDDDKEDTNADDSSSTASKQLISVKHYNPAEGQTTICFKDYENHRLVETISIDYMDFWSMIELDDNDFYGCTVFCGATKELCALLFGVFLILGLVFAAVTISNNRVSPTTLSAVNEMSGDVVAPYPICQVAFANDYLNVLDLVYLTVASYYSDKAHVRHLFDIWFANESTPLNDTGWLFDQMHISPVRPSFFHVPHSNGLDLVSVRGTFDLSDVLQDISLYTQVSTLQMFSWVLPLTTILPVTFIRDFVRYSAIPEGMIDPTLRQRYDQPIYDYVRTNMSEALKSDKTVLIVGHSLGGGIAEIVAAKFADQGYRNVYSFGLSSPGTVYSSSKFGFSIEALDKSSISVLPRRDPVSAVDVHGGVAQVIECDAGEMVMCHLAARSFCELFRECGQSMARNISFAQCVCGIGNGTNSQKTWDDCM